MSQESFEAVCLAWVQSALSYLAATHIPMTQVSRFTYSRDSYTSAVSLASDPLAAIAQGSQDLLQLAPTVDVLGEVQSDPDLKALAFTRLAGDVSEPTEQMVLTFVLKPLLAAYVRAYQIGPLNYPGFNTVYNEFLAYLASQMIPVRWLIYLRKLVIDNALILEDATVLRPPTRGELEWLMKQISFVGGTFPRVRDIAILEVGDSADRRAMPDEIDQTRARNQLFRVSLILRLLTPIRVYPVQLRWVTQPKFRLITEFATEAVPRWPIMPDAPYRVTDVARADIIRLWPTVLPALTDPAVLIGARRFIAASDRETTQDQLIDYWIALEALFLPTGQLPDMADVTALAVAHGLGRSAAERKRIRDDIVRSYKWRSHTVHGERGSQPEGNLEHVTRQTEHYLRRALKQRLLEENLLPDNQLDVNET